MSRLPHATTKRVNSAVAVSMLAAACCVAASTGAKERVRHAPVDPQSSVIQGEVVEIFSPRQSGDIADSIVLAHNAEIRLGDLSVSGERIVFDTKRRVVEGRVLRVEAAVVGKASSDVSTSSTTVTTLQCRPRPRLGSELIVNGRPTGTFPTPTNPDRSTIPGAQIACSGRDVLLITGAGSFIEP